MKSLYSSLILLACSCVLNVACTSQHASGLSASATAESSSDGSVQARESNAAEVADIQRTIRKREAVDALFPGSSIPLDASQERVVAINVPGILELEDGRKVRLDGIGCDAIAVGYMRRILQEKSVSVVVLPSSRSNVTPIPAEIWTADTDLQTQGLAKSPAYSNLTETAITSGWCKVEATATSKHNARYAALAKMFRPTGDGH